MGNGDYIYFLSMEKILLVSIGQWQVGEGRLTNSAVATEPILYSFLSFLKLSTVKKTFSKHAWQSTWQWRRMFVLTEAQILVYQDERISFPLGAFAENLLFGLTKTEHGIFFRQDLERQWHEISFQWPLSKFREMTT